MNVRALRRLQDALPNDPLLLTTATTLTDLAAFRMTLWNSTTAFAITLPKSTGSGKMYYFGIGKVAGSSAHTLVTASGDFVAGSVFLDTTGGASGKLFQANGTSNTTLTLNGTAQGGQLGDVITYWDAVSGVWFAQGLLVGSSVGSTPWS